MRLTLKKWSRRHQIRPEPLVRANQRISTQPIPTPTNRLVSTMNNDPMSEIRKPTIRAKMITDVSR